MEEKIIIGEQDIKLDLIDNFPNHPYHVFDDVDMAELVASIEANGLLNPIVVRNKADGRYELISGHRRKRAYDHKLFKGIIKRVVVTEQTLSFELKSGIVIEQVILWN